MSKITYIDKINNQVSALPNQNKVSDVDMNEIKTVVNNNDDELIALTNDLSDLEDRSGAVPYTYQFDSSTVEADPSNGKFRLDFALPASSGAIYISQTDQTLDAAAFGNLVASDALYIQSRDIQKQGLYCSIGTVTDNGSWYKITYAVASSAGDPFTSGESFQILPVKLTGGGSGDVATDTIWNNKGDIAVATASNAASVVPVGAEGEILTVDPAETNGVKWSKQQAAFSMALSDENVTDLVASGVTPVFTKYISVPVALQRIIWNEIKFDVVTAPTGSAIIIDVHKNGSTIFSVNPTIAIGANRSTTFTATTTEWVDGDKMEIFVTQIGSTVAGKGLKGTFNGYYI